MPSHARRPLAAAIALAAAGAAIAVAPQAASGKAPEPKVKKIVRGAGDIRPAVQRFRALLGPDNGGAPGGRAKGRREINWDGVPDELASPNAYPSAFFNARAAPRARGAVLTTPGTGLRVSADSANPAGAAPLFADINLSTSTGAAAHWGASRCRWGGTSSPSWAWSSRPPSWRGCGSSTAAGRWGPTTAPPWTPP